MGINYRYFVPVAEIERQNKEREKAAKEKAKREEKENRARQDLPFLKEQLGRLYALLDIAEAEYAATTNLQKQARFLRTINSLNAQIHAAELKYNAAEQIVNA